MTWDQTVDLLIVGSGAGAMGTAICVHDRGAKTLLIEKTALYGGSSAMSGGSLWIPNNHLMAAAGMRDSPAEALTYLKHITRGAGHQGLRVNVARIDFWTCYKRSENVHRRYYS